MHIQTHPGEIIGSAFPSAEDLAHLIHNDNEKTMTIAVRKSDEGDVIGYTMLFKNKSFPIFKNIKEDKAAFGVVEDALVEYDESNLKPPTLEQYTSLKKLEKSLGFGIQFHPARGYYLNKETGNYEKKSEHSLEGAIGSILIGFSLMFLLAKIPFTGFIISNSISNSSKLSLFLIIGFLFSMIVYFIFRMTVKKS